MNEFFTSVFEASLPILEFLVTAIMPVLGLVLMAVGFGIAITKAFDIFWTVHVLTIDVKTMRKEMDRMRRELMDLQFKSNR